MARAAARIAAMQLIFERFSGGEGGEDTLHMVYDELREEKTARVNETDPGVADRAWIEQVLGGVLSCRDELDEKIASVSRNWSIDRMAKVDLAILRLAVWELLHEQDVPGNVVISEAVELANRYSGDGSGRFINGILGAILRSQQEAGQS